MELSRRIGVETQERIFVVAITWCGSHDLDRALRAPAGLLGTRLCPRRLHLEYGGLDLVRACPAGEKILQPRPFDAHVGAKGAAAGGADKRRLQGDADAVSLAKQRDRSGKLP